MSINNPVVSTYTLKAASLVGGAATLLKVIGPKGLNGVLIGMSAVTTTAVTVAATDVLVGITGTTAKYGTLAVPVATIGSGYNAPTIAAVDSNVIPADSIVLIGTGGAATAGAADITVTIAWI